MNITTDELAQRIAIMAVCWAGSSANRRQAAPAVALRGIDQYEEEHAMPTTHRLDGDPRTDHDTSTCQDRGCASRPAGHEDWIRQPEGTPCGEAAQ